MNKEKIKDELEKRIEKYTNKKNNEEDNSGWYNYYLGIITGLATAIDLINQ